MMFDICALTADEATPYVTGKKRQYVQLRPLKSQTGKT
jgi:hypothetical protein